MQVVVVDGVSYRVLRGHSCQRFGLFSHHANRILVTEDLSGESGKRPHLLHVVRSQYAEQVRRFDLTDIQALTLVNTASATAASITLALLAAASGLLFWYASAVGASDDSFNSFLLIISLLTFVACLFFLALNLFLGGTCRCELWTAATCEPLTSLGRRRTAESVFDELKASIDFVQGGPAAAGAVATEPVAASPPVSGELAPDAPPSEPSRVEAPRTEPAVLSAATGVEAPAISAPVVERLSRVHLILCAFLCLDAALSAADSILPVWAGTPVFIITNATLCATAIAALVMHARAGFPQEPPARNLRVVTWATMLYVWMCVTLSGFGYMRFFFTGVAIGGGEGPEVADQLMASFSRYFNVVAIASDLVLAVWGIVAVADWRRRLYAERAGFVDIPEQHKEGPP